MTLKSESKNTVELFRHWITILLPIIGLLLVINQVFNIQFFSANIIIDKSFNFLIAGILLPLVFVHFPLKKKHYFYWLDIVLFFICGILFFILSWNGYEILFKGYEYSAPLFFVIISVFIWAILIESVRRTANNILMIIILFFSLYPLIAEHMPGVMQGVSRPFNKIAVYHILSDGSAMGTLLKVFVSVVFGYIVFGEAIVATGGAEFLINAARRIIGRTRGGTAKMAIIASALFGSISGSPIANVITTGNITIPAMKKSGFNAYYAGAVESCASTAGTLTPPIMGATAFILASFINVSYTKVAFAALIPAVLFYLSLFIQVDGYSAMMDIRDEINEDENSRINYFKKGWFYLPTLLILFYFLFILRWVSEAPYIATVVMFIFAQLSRETRLNFKDFLQFFKNMGKSLAVLLSIMIGVGFLLGSFSLTGIASTFSREIFLLAGGNLILMLILTAVISLILGMGMTAIACYIFLALTIAPALVSAGVNELSAHLFLLYCGMLSYITPPVALCAFAAANIANVSPMKIAFTACRLGGAIYILPFLFVLDPALTMQGDPQQIIYAFLSCALGVIILSSGLEGYLIGIGNLRRFGSISIFLRVILIMSGLSLALSGWKSDILGIVLFIVFIIVIFVIKHVRKAA